MRATWRGATEIVARGGTFLVAVYHHPAACLAVFRILIGAERAAFALDVILDVFVPLHFVALLIAAALMALRFHESRRGWAAAIETAAVWALFARVSPLVAFGVYFNGIHSVRHVLRVLDFSIVQRQQQHGAALHGTMPLAWAAVLYTIPVLLAAGAIFSGSSRFRGENLLSFATHDVLRVIFIGLSALTTPHVVLVAKTFSS
jgi:Brp/Blh family beta-carotene 15,15'-monooxygenase